MDVPNTAGASKQLVHDIDLIVYGPPNQENTHGMIWRGNNNSLGDDVNNAEAVYIVNPTCGIYEIVLSGSLFLNPTYQSVSVVITTTSGSGYVDVEAPTHVSSSHPAPNLLKTSYYGVSSGVVVAVTVAMILVLQYVNVEWIPYIFMRNILVEICYNI